jgi:hypothetical protein
LTALAVSGGCGGCDTTPGVIGVVGITGVIELVVVAVTGLSDAFGGGAGLFGGESCGVSGSGVE